mgnify:FL=1
MKRISWIKVIAVAGVFSLTSSSAYAVTSAPTASQKAALQYLVEEEKLARDVYAYIAKNITNQKFANIVKSEQAHMDEISRLMSVYGIYNPTTSRKAGVFKNVELQKLYGALIKEAGTSAFSAFAVGQKIENMDIVDLKKILEKDMPADMNIAVTALLRGSTNHLAAFSR